jgi:chemotaxis protein MotB
MRHTLLLLVTLGLAAGCGVKRETHQKALDHIQLLEGRLSQAEADAADRDKRIRALEADLGIASQSERALRGEKEATEAELTELRRQREMAERRMASYRRLQQSLKKLVETGALEVQLRHGQMTLKLPSGVLFPSGSADLSKEGKATLGQVTEALMGFKDRRFLIAGHTDSVPIKTRLFRNNWYLSTARAVSVLEFMIGAGFPATQLGAAGYADQDPVGDNTTEQGREQNRRIEIILVPDLSELPQLSEERGGQGES